MDISKDQFITDLCYFNYTLKLKKPRYLEKTKNFIDEYNEDEVFNEEYYLKSDHHRGGQLTMVEGWLDMGIYPSYDNSYDDIFNEDESKYVIYLYLWVLKINMNRGIMKSMGVEGEPLDIYIRNDKDRITGLDEGILKEIYDKVDEYYDKSRSENKKKVVKNKITNISEIMDQYDEIYTHLYPVIKRIAKPITNDDIESNKQYNNRKVHKSNTKKQLIRYFNGEDNIDNERFIKLFAYTLRSN